MSRVDLSPQTVALSNSTTRKKKKKKKKNKTSELDTNYHNFPGFISAPRGAIKTGQRDTARGDDGSWRTLPSPGLGEYLYTRRQQSSAASNQTRARPALNGFYD